MVVDRKKQYARQNEWNRKNRKRISIVMTPEKAENVKRVAERAGQSVNAYINDAINERMSRDDRPDNVAGDNNQDNNKSDNNNGIKYR